MNAHSLFSSPRDSSPPSRASLFKMEQKVVNGTGLGRADGLELDPGDRAQLHQITFFFVLEPKNLPPGLTCQSGLSPAPPTSPYLCTHRHTPPPH